MGDRFPLPVNTGRVDRRTFPLAELTGRVDGPSTLPVETRARQRYTSVLQHLYLTFTVSGFDPDMLQHLCE